LNNILLGASNDHPRQAAALAQLLRGFQSHVNLIRLQPIETRKISQRPSRSVVAAFKSALELRHVAVSVPRQPGCTNNAACGQLGGGWRG